LRGKFIKVNSLFAICHSHEKSARFLVTQEKVLGADGWNAGMVLVGFGAREYGGMLDPLKSKLIGVQIIEEILFSCNHVIYRLSFLT
jgi:hypothetical protein